MSAVLDDDLTATHVEYEDFTDLFVTLTHTITFRLTPVD